jgi:chromosome segregation ATPase
MTVLLFLRTWWKPLGAVALLAALAAAFVAHGNHRYRAGVASMQPAIDRLNAALATAHASIATLQAAVDQQNAAVAQARADGEARVEQARQAAQEAAQRESGREATRRALEAPGRSTGLTADEWSNL